MPSYQIKVSVNDSRVHNTLTSNRYLIEVVPQFLLTIEHFLTHVCDLCELKFNPQKHEIYLQLDGFIIPSKSSISMLKPTDTKIYQIQVKNKKIVNKEIKSMQIQQDSLNMHETIRRQRQSSPSTPQWERKQAKKKAVQKKKLANKEHTNKNSTKKVQIKKYKEESSSSSQSSEQSSSLQSLNPKKKVKPNNPKPKPIIQEILKQKPKITLQKPKPQITIQNAKPQTTLQKPKPHTILQKPKSTLQKVQNQPPIKKNAIQNTKNKTESLENKNVIIPNKTQAIQKKSKQVIVRCQSSRSDEQINNQISKPRQQIQIHIQKPALIPPSVRRQKQTQGSFSKNQQQQWLLLSQECLKKYEQKYATKLLQADNIIRFKIVQFDEEKFQPKLSEWIKGQVVSFDGSEIKMKKVKKDTQYFQTYSINIINTAQLSISKSSLKDTQSSFLINSSKEAIKDSQHISVNNNNGHQKETQQQHRLNSQQAKQPNNNQSLEDFICLQLNYYFSDKNYQKDLLMQMHANSDPQQYVELEFILSFPKIKKTRISLEQLSFYLSTDPQIDFRNYELSDNKLKIRKKGAERFHKAQDKKDKNQQILQENVTQKIQNKQQNMGQEQKQQRVQVQGANNAQQIANNQQN